MVQQGYAGWEGDQLARVEATIEPRTFFTDFVARRRPCVLTGHLAEPGWRAHLWTDEYLARVAGDEVVTVEVRAHASEAFGRGVKETMRFGEFLARAGAGDDRLYLSAQPLPEGEDGPTELCAPPLRGQLARDVPVRPRLLGQLVPQQLNVWMGSSTRPSSSGLHHDFHDNLYVLLRGRKRFALFPPSRAAALRTSGRIGRVHPNGLISYADMPTRADGLALALARRRARAGEAAQRLLAAGAALAAARQAGASARVVRGCERALAEADAATRTAPAPARARAAPIGRAGGESDEDDWPVDDFDDYDDGDDASAADAGSASGDEGAGTGRALPANFCTAPAPAGLAPVEVELRAREMLYLPAGWFHEVRSCNAAGAGGTAGAAAGAAGSVGHFALNVWLHPPDTSEFERPYSEPYWEQRYAALFGAQHEAVAGAGAAEAGPAHARARGSVGARTSRDGRQPFARRAASRLAGRRIGQLSACALRSVHPLRSRPWRLAIVPHRC